MNKKLILPLFFAAFLVLKIKPARAQGNPIGIFDGQTDVGNPKNKGTGTYDAKEQQYFLSGSGTNIWFKRDEFHFVWKKMKGDFILRTNTAFIGKAKKITGKWAS